MLELLKQIGVARLVAVLGVTGGVAAVLAAIMLRLGDPPMALLFSGLDMQDAQEITQRLEQSNTPYELRGGGAAILVPKDQVLNLRLSLSSEGIPSGGVVGYEIFDQSDTIGATSFVQGLNRLRALEGELARTIGAIDVVRSARVHLVVPQRELFSRDKPAPKASIVLDLRRGALPSRTVQAIQNLVASAVPDLTPDRVTILDSGGALLARGGGEDDPEALAATQYEERTAATEARIRRTVEDIVTRIVGPENARVQVSAEIDFNRVTISAEEYDPDKQVVLSTQTIEKTSSSRDSEQNESVSVANNLPEAEADEGPGQESSSNSSELEEIVNYQNSKTLRTEVLETGAVERLSVAVAVNGAYETAEDGSSTYTPRTSEEMQRITALVKSAIGYREGRDQLEVVNIQFARPELPPVEEEAAPFLGLTKDDYLRIAEIAVLGILGLILILFVLRPFLSARSNEETATPATQLPLPADGAPAQLTGPAGEQAAGAALMAHPGAAGAPAISSPDVNEFQQQIDIAQVQGQVKASSVKKVAEIVDKHPEESLAILRNWLHEA